MLALPEKDPETTVLTVTRSGQVKRSSIEDYDGATRKGGVRGVGLDDGDQLVGAFTVRDGDDVMLIADSGKAIRFAATDVRVMGRTAGGVRGIKLDDGEALRARPSCQRAPPRAFTSCASGRTALASARPCPTSQSRAELAEASSPSRQTTRPESWSLRWA